jgi:hypothetical protein
MRNGSSINVAGSKSPSIITRRLSIAGKKSVVLQEMANNFLFIQTNKEIRDLSYLSNEYFKQMICLFYN